MTNISDLSDTITAKSDQLNADDLIVEKTIKVTAINRTNQEQPISISYDGDSGRPFKPCLSMRRLLIAAWGANGAGWVGRYMTLYKDPTVIYAGQAVGGIRISHLSHIDKGFTVKLAINKKQKKEYKVEPLKPQEPVAYPDFEGAFPKIEDAIVSGKMTAEQAITQCEKKGFLTEDQMQRIRNVLSVDESEILGGE